MISSFVRAAAAATVGLTLWGAATASNATIYNISATGGGLDVTLAAGNYLISWVGVADGGLYNAWNGNCPTGDCNSGWSNTFNAIDLPIPPGGNFTVQIFGVGPTQSSALASLLAIQSAATIGHGEVNVTANVAGGFIPLPAIPQPWIAEIDGGTIHFGAGDGTPENNFGGVSLRVTAVPEPATWSMLIAGFGLIGAALRRRRAPAIA